MLLAMCTYQHDDLGLIETPSPYLKASMGIGEWSFGEIAQDELTSEG